VHVTEDRVIERHREPRPYLTGSRPNRPDHQNLGSRLYRLFIAARIGRSPNRPSQTHRNLSDCLGWLSPNRATAFSDPPLPNRINSRQLNLVIAADERHIQMYSRGSNNTVRQIWNLGAVNRCHSLSDVAVKRRFY
jgi:hypothetical protein